MKRKPRLPLTADELRRLHRQRRRLIRERLGEFSRVPRSELFYELAYCLLTPQSSAVNAGKAVDALKAQRFLADGVDPEPLLHQPDFYIRFHKTKAKNLLAARDQFPLVLRELSNGRSSPALRLWLVNQVRGLGWKEASHFLRNVGHRDLAILDRHILRNLIRTGVLRRLPKTLTAKRYAAIEAKFRDFAGQVGIPMDELDLLFWSMETGTVLK
jgi:N-glycosylase/DNA lyase